VTSCSDGPKIEMMKSGVAPGSSASIVPKATPPPADVPIIPTRLGSICQSAACARDSRSASCASATAKRSTSSSAPLPGAGLALALRISSFGKVHGGSIGRARRGGAVDILGAELERAVFEHDHGHALGVEPRDRVAQVGAEAENPQAAARQHDHRRPVRLVGVGQEHLHRGSRVL
jgi:hypothetical protein